MSELVKQSDGVIPGDEYRLAGLTLYEIRVIRNDRLDVSVYALLAAIRVHPRTRPFSGTCIRIEIPKADVCSRCLVRHFPNSNVRMKDGNVRYRCEIKIEKLARYPEHRLTHFVELKVRL